MYEKLKEITFHPRSKLPLCVCVVVGIVGGVVYFVFILWVGIGILVSLTDFRRMPQLAVSVTE